MIQQKRSLKKEGERKKMSITIWTWIIRIISHFNPLLLSQNYMEVKQRQEQ